MRSGWSSSIRAEPRASTAGTSSTATSSRSAIRDPRTGNIDGEYQLRVQITPDTLTFKLLGDGGNDAWFVSTWEVAPFVKRR